MSDNRLYIQKYAMHFGTYMGVYWIIKFIFFPLGLTNMFLLLVFAGLTVAVPFIGFSFAKVFRDKVCGGYISFAQVWVFLVFMFLFASLLTAVGHYIYYSFIDNGYVIEAYNGMVETFVTQAKSSGVYSESMIGDMEELFKNTIEEAAKITPIERTMQMLSQNILICSVLAIFISMFVSKRKAPEAV